MSDYGYKGGYGDQQPTFIPMMPQPGNSAGNGSGWLSQQRQLDTTSGSVPDDAEEDGYCMPRQLLPGLSVPVTRCPDGSWAISFVMNGCEFHSVAYVQVTDGSFAPYHMEGMGALRVAWDVPDGGQPYLARVSQPTGKAPHVLHLPESEGIPSANRGNSA